MRLLARLQLHSQMFQLFLVSLVLQVSTVNCEEPTTAPDYPTIDYSEFEVLYPNIFLEFPNDINETEQDFHPASNSASSTYSSCFNTAVLLLFYLVCHVLHHDLLGSTSVGRTRVHEGEKAGEIWQHQDLPPKFLFSNSMILG